MDANFMMLLRYAIVAYMMYRYGADAPLIDPIADLTIAAVTVTWGVWSRWSGKIKQIFKSLKEDNVDPTS